MDKVMRQKLVIYWPNVIRRGLWWWWWWWI